MSRTTDLNAAIAAIEANLKVAKHLASIAEEIRFDLPQGYSAQRDRDGIRRPVEALMIAQQDRGVMPLITEAVTALNTAAVEVANGARAMDHAIDRWESKKNR